MVIIKPNIVVVNGCCNFVDRDGTSADVGADWSDETIVIVVREGRSN